MFEDEETTRVEATLFRWGEVARLREEDGREGVTSTG